VSNMSCRIYKGPDAHAAIDWPSVSETSVAPIARPRPEPRREPDGLDTRLGELTAKAEAQAREARAAGFTAGKQAASAELAPVLERLSASLADLAGVKARLRKQAESDTVKLAVAIAKRILRRELAVDPHAVQGILSAALERIQSAELCSVTLHPDHEHTIRTFLDRQGVIGVRILADRSLNPGDVRFETSRGTLDASIDSQLSEIERGLVDRLGK
jgi:flagellar assembly protein FliH